MAAAQLTLLSNPTTAGFLGMPGQPAHFPYAGASNAAPQVKPEPVFPTNASRPYYPDREDRASRYNSNRDYDHCDTRRDPRYYHEYNRPTRYDYRDDYRS